MRRGESDVEAMIVFGAVMTLAVLAALFGAVADFVVRFFA